MPDTNPYQPLQVPAGVRLDSDAPTVNAAKLVFLATALMLVTGFASHTARRIWQTNPHWDAIVLLAILVCTSIWLMCWCGRFPPRHALGRFHLGMLSCWLAAIVGWELGEIAYPKFPHLVMELPMLLGAWHVGIAVLGSIVILLRIKFAAKRRAHSHHEME